MGQVAQRSTAITKKAEENSNSSAFIPLNPFVICTVRDLRVFPVEMLKIEASLLLQTAVTDVSKGSCAIVFRIKQSSSQPVGSYIRQHYNPLKG